METAIFIYEVGQLGALKHFLSEIPEKDRASYVVFALGADIEMILEGERIPFTSGEGLRSSEHIDLMTYVEKTGREVSQDPSFSFFSYRNIYLPKVFQSVLQYYLLLIIYYLDVMTTFAQQYPQYKRLVVLPPTEIPPEGTGGILSPLKVTTAIDAARLVSERFDFEVVVPALEQLQTPTERFRSRVSLTTFALKRALFGLALALFNILVALTSPRKEICILASENWKNISTLMLELPEAEVLLLDRTEAFKIGLKSIWKNRMRFIHLEDYVSRAMRKSEALRIRNFAQEWQQAQHDNTALQKAEFRGNKMDSILVAALHAIVTKGAVRALPLIDGSYALCKRTEPDIVIVRASVSGQIHFPILCYVARQLGIPSLEIQHGIFYTGQGSFFDHPAAEYVATYGPLASLGLKEVGYADDQLFDVGSPRFDVYRALRAKADPAHSEPNRFTILCIVPEVIPESWSDTYEIIKFFSNIAAAVKRIPHARAILKLRPIVDNEVFYHRAIAQSFGDTPHRIAHYEPIVDLLGASDAVVAIYSTTILESLLSGRPVIYNATLKMHDAIGKEFIEYADAGTLIVARTPEELASSLELLARDPDKRKALVEHADAFMKRNYCFRGNSSKELADIIRDFKKKKTEKEKGSA